MREFKNCLSLVGLLLICLAPVGQAIAQNGAASNTVPPPRADAAQPGQPERDQQSQRYNALTSNIENLAADAAQTASQLDAARQLRAEATQRLQAAQVDADREINGAPGFQAGAGPNYRSALLRQEAAQADIAKADANIAIYEPRLKEAKQRLDDARADLKQQLALDAQLRQQELDARIEQDKRDSAARAKQIEDQKIADKKRQDDADARAKQLELEKDRLIQHTTQPWNDPLVLVIGAGVAVLLIGGLGLAFVLRTRGPKEKPMPRAWLQDDSRISGNDRIEIATPVFRIGRNPVQNELVLEPDTISGNHAAIFFNNEDGSFRLRDAASTNRTFLTRNRVRQELRPHTDGEVALKSGDLIHFGSYPFRFRVEGGVSDTTLDEGAPIAPKKTRVADFDEPAPPAAGMAGAEQVDPRAYAPTLAKDEDDDEAEGRDELAENFGLTMLKAAADVAVEGYCEVHPEHKVLYRCAECGKAMCEEEAPQETPAGMVCAAFHDKERCELATRG